MFLNVISIYAEPFYTCPIYRAEFVSHLQTLIQVDVATPTVDPFSHDKPPWVSIMKRL